MYILAIEQSTATCSVAVMRDYNVICENEWVDTRFRNQHFFSVLPGLLEKAGITPLDIDILATGLGPGSFSGLRCALSALNGIALPDRKRIFGITSAEIIAWQAMQETSSKSVMVVGDARRSHIWFAHYDRKEELAICRGSISLVIADLLPSKLISGETIVTPDWDRIGTMLQSNLPSGCRLTEGKQIPKARTAGELACRKTVLNIPSEQLTPVYLHPPVAPRHS